MTNVASEASAVLNRPAPSRSASSKGGQADGGFAALMESQVERRDEPRPARTDRAQARRTERDDPADKATSGDSSAKSDGPVRSDGTKDAGRPTEKPAVEAKDSAQPAEGSAEATTEEKATDGAATVTAAVAPPVPVSQTVVTPAVPAMPVATAPVVAAPGETSVTPTEATSAPTTALPTTPAATTPVTAPAAQQPVDADGQVTVPAQTAQTPGTPAANSAQQAATAVSANPQNASKNGQALAGDATTDTEAEASVETTQAEPEELFKEAKQPTVQNANSAQTQAKSDKPELKSEPTFKPDDIVSPKLTTEQTPQLTPHLPAHATAATAATPQAAPVGSAQAVPVNAIAVEIAGQAKAGNTRFEIRLDPPELGRIDVRLDVDKDGNVTSRLVIERADTYDLLRRDQSTLERALQQAGLKTSDNSLEFSLRDQGFAQHQRQDDDTPRGVRTLVAETDIMPSEAANGYARLLGGRSGVDIRV